jgi:hypothetical protein
MVFVEPATESASVVVADMCLHDTMSLQPAMSRVEACRGQPIP